MPAHVTVNIRGPVGGRTPLMAPRRSALQLLATVLAAAGLLLGPGIGTAAAHDVLVASTPAPDTTVEATPAAVSLEFSQAPQPLGARVVVTGPDGAEVADGEAQARDRTVVQPLAGDLLTGRYTVDWRITSADGHPLTGTFAFSVEEGPATAVAPASNGSPAAPDSGFPVIWLAVAAVVAVGAVLIVRQVRRPA
jgi:copper resistance protein C